MGKPPAPATMARRLACLSHFYRRVFYEGLLERNPFEFADRPKVPEQAATAGLGKRPRPAANRRREPEGARGERRSFQLPGGDGGVVLAAGLWAALLLVLRLFDKPGITTHGVAANVGIQWGIFFALAAAGMLAAAGSRMRAGARSESPLLHPRESRRKRHGEEYRPVPRRAAPGERPLPPSAVTVSRPGPARGRPRYPSAPGESIAHGGQPSRRGRLRVVGTCPGVDRARGIPRRQARASIAAANARYSARNA
jgi:hypothetical protein